MLVPFASPSCTFYSQRTPKIPTKNRTQVLTLSAPCLPNIFAGKHCLSLNLSRKVEQPSGERTHSSSILIYLNQQAAIAFAIIIRQFVYLLTPLLPLLLPLFLLFLLLVLLKVCLVAVSYSRCLSELFMTETFRLFDTLSAWYAGTLKQAGPWHNPILSSKWYLYIL